MSRIKKLEPESWPESLRDTVQPEGLTPLEQSDAIFRALPSVVVR